jgi:branched-chain amino acid transport system permease protein
VVAVIAVALLFWFLNRTRTGKAMRAFSDNEDLALLSGINPERVVVITWLIVAALATTAGVLYGLDKSSSPSPISSFCCRSSPRPSSAASAIRWARSSAGS